MRHLLTALALSTALSGTAHAADKPLFGPVPAWVKPVAAPAPSKPDDAAVRVLLSDQQIDLTRERQTVYSDIALRIQTPQGLAAGSVTFAWRPETDTPTVHKLRIRRGAEIIDVLASGQTFTILRRESRLEHAMLDGVLTATIQPEGLQVGDVIEFAASVSSTDPVMRGHVEHLTPAWNGAPVGRAHLRVRWPASIPARIRSTHASRTLKPVTADGLSSIELSLDDVEPVAPPKGAPPRFAIGQVVELTDFTSWGDLAALMAPLYARASILPTTGPLAAEVARIKALSTDPKVRAEAALALVQDRVRYVALSMGAGGLVPADTGTTWSRRYGDCKGKTALLLGLLRALDIDAEAVAVGTGGGDGLDARLPMIGLFDHVLVRATVGGRTYWLDGTRTGDGALDRLGVPPFGWGLPLVAKGGALVRMVPAPLRVPTYEVAIRMDATAGLAIPAPTRIETVLRGDDAIGARAWLAGFSGAARDKALRDYWKSEYDFIDARSATATFDANTGEQRLVLEGDARMDWSSGWYETDGTRLGYKADFARDPGPGRDAPFAVRHPHYTRVSQTIMLPAFFKPLTEDGADDVEQTIAGIEYRRRARLKDGVFTIEKTERSVAAEFPFSEAASAQTALRALVDKAVLIRKPTNYVSTAAEITATIAIEPTTARGFIERGGLLMDGRRYDEAIKDYDRASALDPKNAWALANRGMARTWKEDFVGAARDLDAAAAIDPRNAVVFRARGRIAHEKGAYTEAVAQYSKSLDLDPDNDFTLGHRALAYRAAGDLDRALADSAASLKLVPDWPNLYLMRADIFRSRGEKDKAAAEAAAAIAASPAKAYTHVMAANIYHGLGRRAEMMRAYDRALAVKPEAFTYFNRAVRRPKEDVAGRRADIEAALKLDPVFEEAVGVKARLQIDAGDEAGAVGTYTTALAAGPDNPYLLTGRGILRTEAGQADLAARDFARARANATTASQLNEICWGKATGGVALDLALTECDAAIAKEPGSAAMLDSRAFVLLRLGRIDDAIAAYDRALARAPDQAASLFGRAVAWSRKGDKARSATDRAAALKIAPEVEEEFKRYGVTP